MDEVATLRRFNRGFTQRIGVLAESYLDTGRPLGPSRLLFEIGDGGAPARVGELRRRLDLDSGYLSRLLRQLEDARLVTVAADPDDRRQRIVALTTNGRREWALLDRRSEEVARELIAPLPARRRNELATALETAERLLRAATVSFAVVDPAAPEARAAMAQYFAELDRRFPTGFDEAAPGHAAVAPMRAPDGGFVLMTSDRLTLGCGGVQRIDDATAEIKRMWIHAEWRSLGLGRRMLGRLEQLAGELGRSRVVLDTNATLVEAIAMYERAGYRSIDRYNDNPYAEHWFAKEL